MLTALHAAKAKLSHYYAMTDNIHGDLYAIGTIIVPQYKLQFFSTKDWDEPGQDWRGQYRQSLEDGLKPYRKRILDTYPLSKAASPVRAQDELDLVCDAEDFEQTLTGEQDELKQYLESGKCYAPVYYVKLTLLLGTIRTHPRLFWKDHQHEFPALAHLARDILSVPATGAGVERLFNSARDVCHYRRGSLKPETIRDLMMFMCTSKFDLDECNRQKIGQEESINIAGRIVFKRSKPRTS
jgi:hypothetical protein